MINAYAIFMPCRLFAFGRCYPETESVLAPSFSVLFFYMAFPSELREHAVIELLATTDIGNKHHAVINV
jgi:hypothetical protein